MKTSVKHQYNTFIKWESKGGTKNYKSYSRNHLWSTPLKPAIQLSSDTAYCGDDRYHNPEELLVASISSCHMLWYLHLCADNDITVYRYEDNAIGLLEDREPLTHGRFSSVDLNPATWIHPDSDHQLAQMLHKTAHNKCFVTNSVNFPIHVHPTIHAMKVDVAYNR